MLSVIMSGLNVAKEDLAVSANNLANASTVGFKRSDASFLDIFSNDPSSNPKTAVGLGAITGAVTRSTNQGSMTTTGRVTDLAIAGRGYFTLSATDPETGSTNIMYTRSGAFNVNAEGQITDSIGNQLQCFPVSATGQVMKTLQGAVIPPEKTPAEIRVALGASTPVGSVVSLTLAGQNVASSPPLTATDVANGYVSIQVPGVSSADAPDVGASYPVTTISVPLAGNEVAGQSVEIRDANNAIVGTKVLTSEDIVAGHVNFSQPSMSTAQISSLTANYIDSGTSTAITATITGAASTQVAASEYRGVYLQGISINSKGMIQASYGDGSKTDIGAVALANFRNDAALKAIGNTNFVASQESGQATMTRAGAPFAGDILSSTLEQANVDITQELMTMLRAQQVYNGNARMLQTEVEVSSRITDKL